MLTVAPLAAGQANYYLSLASTAAGYYIDKKGLEPAGIWYGPGAKEFGLEGVVRSEDLNAICRGFSPDGKYHVRNADGPKRKHGTDLCFSVPKSVSVIWGLATPEMRSLIEAAVNRAVRDALDYIQATCGFARVGAQGQVLTKVPLTFACFQHASSRNGDIQLHVHCIAPNLALHSEPRRRVTATDPTFYYHHMMSGGAIFRSSLAAELQHLGLEIERDKSAFKIRKVDPKLCELTSTRRAEILEALLNKCRKLGKLEGLSEEEILKATSGRMAEIINLETRRMKKELSRADIFAATRAIADELGLPQDYIEGLLRTPQKLSPERKAVLREEIWDSSIEKISIQQSHWNERELTRMIAEESQGKGLDGRDVRELVAAKLADQELIRIGNLITAEKNDKRGVWRDVSEDRFTTKDILILEGEMLLRADKLDRRSARIDPKFVKSALEITRDKLKAEGHKLSPEQAKAIVNLTGKEGIACLQGLPGTTKSTILGGCRLAWELAGKKVLGTAIAGIAAESLNDSSGIKSDTLAMMLTRLKHDKLRLTPDHVIVLDEAGMVPSRLMADLIKFVHDAGAKLVASGDRGQIQAVEAGGPFASICDRVSNVSNLTEIHRQRETWRKETVEQLHRGGEGVREALVSYAAHGQLHVVETRDLAILKLVELWKQNGGHRKENAHENFIVAPLNCEVNTINRLCQREREKNSELGKRFLTVGPDKIHEHDRIVLTKKDRRLDVENGSRGEVIAVDDASRCLRVRLDKGGREVLIPLETYGADKVKLSYCSTVHLSQGSTRESVFALLGGSFMDKNLSTVAASRSKGVTHLVADHAEVGKDPQLKDAIRTLSRAMSRDRTKDLAMDHLDHTRKLISQDLEDKRSRGIYHGPTL